MNQKNRAALPGPAQDLLPVLERAFEALREASHPNWYPHLSFERRASRTLNYNPRAQKVDGKETMGVMLRIFDGRSLFEASTDQLDDATLVQKARELAETVKREGVAAPATPVYVSPSWKERLSAPLDPEICAQIPPTAASDTWVHFGVPQLRPLFTGPKDSMDYLGSLAERLERARACLAPSEPARNPDFWYFRMRLEEDSFVFLDASVKMTQALLRNSVLAVVTKDADHGHVMKGGLGGRETVELSDEQLHELFRELSKSLRAERLTPGRYKLVMSPGITGVFAHEAFGHTQEADTWARGRSKARELHAAKVRVGNEHATIVNNPAVFRNGEEEFAACGSYYFDEEGWLAGRQELVTEGQLQPPMTNLTSAIRLGVPRTANGKRESWMNAIYSRQTNTYFTPGKATFAELLAQVDYGFLATTCHGGMEDPKGMGIQVGIGYLEEIREGKLTGRTFKGPGGGAVQMTGYVPDYLNAILGKSKIEAFAAADDGMPEPRSEYGGCGKYHKESVVAGCGGTFMLVDKVLLS